MFENFYSFFWDWVKPVVEFFFKYYCLWYGLISMLLHFQYLRIIVGLLRCLCDQKLAVTMHTIRKHRTIRLSRIVYNHRIIMGILRTKWMYFRFNDIQVTLLFQEIREIKKVIGVDHGQNWRALKSRTSMLTNPLTYRSGAAVQLIV